MPGWCSAFVDYMRGMPTHLYGIPLRELFGYDESIIFRVKSCNRVTRDRERGWSIHITYEHPIALVHLDDVGFFFPDSHIQQYRSNHRRMPQNCGQCNLAAKDDAEHLFCCSIASSKGWVQADEEACSHFTPKGLSVRCNTCRHSSSISLCGFSLCLNQFKLPFLPHTLLKRRKKQRLCQEFERRLYGLPRQTWHGPPSRPRPDSPPPGMVTGGMADEVNRYQEYSESLQRELEVLRSNRNAANEEVRRNAQARSDADAAQAEIQRQVDNLITQPPDALLRDVMENVSRGMSSLTGTMRRTGLSISEFARSVAGIQMAMDVDDQLFHNILDSLNLGISNFTITPDDATHTYTVGCHLVTQDGRHQTIGVTISVDEIIHHPGQAQAYLVMRLRDRIIEQFVGGGSRLTTTLSPENVQIFNSALTEEQIAGLRNFIETNLSKEEEKPKEPVRVCRFKPKKEE